MKRSAFVVLLAFVVAPLFMGVLSPLAPVVQSAAGAVTNMTTLLIQLNGIPRAVGVLTSTGTSVNQGTTGATFTLPTGTCFEITCDGSGVMNFGATAALAYTSSNFGHAMSTGQSWYPCSQDTDTNLSFISTTGTVNCNVRRMR